MEQSINFDIVNRYPYLRGLVDKQLFINRNSYQRYICDEKIKIGDKKISEELLIDLITNLSYFKYVDKLFHNEIERLKIVCFDNGDIFNLVYLDKIDIINGIMMLVDTKKIVFDEDSEKRYNDIYKDVCFDNYLEKINGEKFDIVIEGKSFSIVVNDIIDFMMMGTLEFDEICQKKNEIYGMKLEYFCYACLRYFWTNRIFNNYIIPKEIMERFNEISSFQKIDFESVNVIMETEDDNLDKVVINSELRKKILDGIPSLDDLLEYDSDGWLDLIDNDLCDIDKLIKCIYIYIKMCKILTYDEEFYALNHMRAIKEKHKDITHISSITPSNNRAVCYEFNEIYAKMLDDMKINLIVVQTKADEYGSGHALLTFKCGKFLVEADSVDEVLDCDIMHAKVNQLLSGFICINKNIETQNQFDRMVLLVYKLISSREEKIKSESIRIKDTDNISELLHQYDKIRDNMTVNIDEKIDVLIRKVNDSKMRVMDSLSYALQLREILFTKKEREYNFKIKIIRDNYPDNELLASVVLIFILNKINITNESDNDFYIYNPGKDVFAISKQDLYGKFERQELSFIDEDDIDVNIDDNLLGGFAR